MRRILSSIQALFIAFSLSICMASFAQSNRLYTIQQGLRTCDINSLTIDSRGLLWIGGNSPACFFGGTQFHYLNNRDNTGKTLYNTIKQVVEDQNNCYWLITDGGLFYLDSNVLTHERIVLNPEENDDHYYAVRQMVDMDEKGKRKLVMTEGYGIYVLDTQTKQVDRQLSSKLQDMAHEGFISCAFVDSSNHLWLAGMNRSIVCINLSTLKTIEIAMTPKAQAMMAGYLVNRFVQVPSRHAIYIALDGGILKYDTNTRLLDVISGPTQIPYTSFIYTRGRNLLAGSDGRGLWTINEQDSVVPYRLTEPFYDLSMAKVKDITMDSQGNILLAILQKGIYVIPHRSDESHYYPISLRGDGRNTSCVTSIKRDGKGRYWIATDGAGVFLSDTPVLNQARAINDGLRSLQMQTLCIDKRGVVWAGSYGGGIQCHSEGDKGFVTPSWMEMLSNTAIMSSCYDPKTDILYLATNGMGVIQANLSTQRIEPLTYDEKQIFWTSDIHVDPDGTIWICESNNVYHINRTTGKKGGLSKKVMPGSPICVKSTIHKGRKLILIGTTEGLYVYDEHTGEHKHMLEGQKIQSICTDGDDIWLATTSTVCNINLATQNTKEYNNFGGFFLGEFHRRSCLQTGSDELLWGCDNGILSFSPQSIAQPHTLHNKVIFTSLIVGGRMINYNNSEGMLDANILTASKITLPHDENAFSLTFVVPDFSESPNTVYEYILEGYDKEWTTTTFPRIHYSSLPAKTYHLHVRARNDQEPDEMTEQIITIQVTPPWYSTKWAHCAYVLEMILLAVSIFYTVHLRRRRAEELRIARRNEELKEAKLRLFTSITHELRTPLTMIVTPLRQLIATTDDERLRSNLTIMQHNCNRLLNTVGQITDIRKIDAGQFQLHFEEVDICRCVQNVAKSFLGAIEVKKVHFTQENSDQSIHAWIDPTHFEKVLVNLLSNALKFVDEGGNIRVQCQRGTNDISISVFNDGPQIPEKDMARLYERFFQSDISKNHHGSGIGLNLSHELVLLHHGKIETHNVPTGGVEFVIQLPIGCAHLTTEELTPVPKAEDRKESIRDNEEMVHSVAEDIVISAISESEVNPLEESAKPRVLIVDDDRELCEYLQEQLQGHYNVMITFGGNTAWEIVKKHRPDIVITDYMMPDGTGIELTQRIKSNTELDNIPIIMVTGEDDESIQLQSLKLKVDHFMQKPFNLTILEGYILQALGVRENTRRHTKRTDFADKMGKMEMASAEENLYNRITKTLQQHLDDSDYGVRELSEDVGISRVHLNRKMKERYGLSPNAFIKSFRLKQAAYLLINNQVNVSEVAYKVGFSTHSHFSSSFREFFGMSPKEFIAYYTQEENKEALKKLLE